jgi:hypothetical protein
MALLRMLIVEVEGNCCICLLLLDFHRHAS